MQKREAGRSVALYNKIKSRDKETVWTKKDAGEREIILHTSLG